MMLPESRPAIDQQLPLLVDLTEIRSAGLKASLKRSLNELGCKPRYFGRFWRLMISGHTEEIPHDLIVMIDLATLAEKFNKVEPHTWLACVRRRNLMLVAFTHRTSDQKYAHQVDDWCRATDGRLWVYEGKPSKRSDMLHHIWSFLEHRDPEAVTEIRYSDSDQSLWIEFADGLRHCLPWSSLRLHDVEPALRPETVRVGEHPDTIEITKTDGEVFELDSAAVRSILDQKRRRVTYAIAEAATLTLGERLKAYRDSKGMSQTDLATRSGLTQEMISNLERGKHQPRFDTLEKYAKGLGVPITVLLGS
jgi:DNA-binding XRE family transcriptional regulator